MRLLVTLAGIAAQHIAIPPILRSLRPAALFVLIVWINSKGVYLSLFSFRQKSFRIFSGGLVADSSTTSLVVSQSPFSR